MITVTEKWDSGPQTLGEQTSATQTFIVAGTESYVDAMAALLAEVDADFGGALALTSVSLPTRLTQDMWEGRADYGRPTAREVGESEYSFDTGGGSQKITQSFGTTSYAATGTAPDYKGAVGVTKDGVEGVDITIPVYNWTEKVIIPASSVDEAYKLALAAATGKTNDATFRGFAAGEVLFLGASGSQRGVEDWEITFRFAASPNTTGITIGDMEDIQKGGWQYLWVRYEDTEDDDAKAIVKRPVAVYVETVYRSTDFGVMNI